MRELYFLTYWDFKHSHTDGICHKIINQKNAFLKCGFDKVVLTYIKDGHTYAESDEKAINLGSNGRLIGKVNASKRIMQWMNKEGIERPSVYIRYAQSDWHFLHLLKALRKKNAKIAIEIPTYPYDKEAKGLKANVILAIDRHCRKRLHKYADRIVTYSNDDEIYGIPTIKTTNGIDIDAIKIQAYKPHGDTISLIGVAGLAIWHGYDRLIKGLGEYYKNGGKRDIVFHVVGDGAVLAEYKKLAADYGIEDHVIFHGFKSGAGLDELYDGADIAVCCLGLYRKGVYNYADTTLKSREYCMRGVPVIAAGRIDVLPADWRYQLITQNDDSIPDLQTIIDFYDKIRSDRDSGADISGLIREAASEKCSMKNTLADVAAFLNENGGTDKQL